VEVVTGGRGWLLHEGSWVEANPGALLWHVEGDQTIGRSDPEKPYSCLAVRFEGGSSQRHVPHVSFWPDLGQITALTEESIRMFLDESFDGAALLDYLYSKLRYQSLLHEYRRETVSVPEPLRVVRAQIESRYAEALKVGELAQAAGWSVPHLHDRFRYYYQTSPRQMILECRMRSAREQLVGTGYSVKEIAANAGFTHSSAFCSAFRRAMGTSPKAYRDAYFYG
jgi:AraC-like DNA-binding protein